MRAMSTLRSARRLAGVASTLAIMLGAIADAGSGCGDGESVVGGRCVSGYSPCGSTCCLIANQTDGSAATGVDRDAGLVEGSAGGADSGRGDEAVRQSDDASVSDSSEPSAEASAEDSGEDGKKSSTDDAGAEAGFSCAPPSVDCNGVCVDPGTFVGDPNNCGGCGIECPSQLCQS